VNDRYKTAEDAPLTIAASGVLSNDRDPDGDALTAQRVADPAHGALTLNADGSFTYTPNADFSGLDQFIYRANDGELDSAIAVVTIDVAGSNDAPVATDVMVSTVKNQPVAMTLIGSDPDGDDLTYQMVDIPAQGDLNGGDNLFTYTPATDFTGQQTFTYRVNDGAFDSNLATVTINVIDVDLAITGVDVSQTAFDPNTMTVSGDVTVTWNNAGAVPVAENYTVKVYVEDTQTNTTIELGTAVAATPLNPGEIGSAVVSVSGAILFKDQPVYAVVDSDNVVLESNEDNNIANNLLDCQMPPSESGQFNPVVKFHALQDMNVISTQMVANLSDDNHDSAIDEYDIPDIIVIATDSFYMLAQFYGGFIKVLSGDDGHELFTTAQQKQVAFLNELAVGDIDGDGLPEIIAAHVDGRHLIAFENTGEIKWISDDDILSGRSDSGGAISIANLDGKGLPEIVIGASVYSAEGKLLADGRDIGGTTGFSSYTAISAIADINLDGTPEIIAGPSVYQFTEGRLSLLWRRTDVVDGYIGIANFDSDPFPEIVIVGSGRVYLLNHDGARAEVWNPQGAEYVSLPSGGTGGAPTISDYDGDGALEVGIAGGSAYSVFNHDGSLLWSRPTNDWSSSNTGSKAMGLLK